MKKLTLSLILLLSTVLLFGQIPQQIDTVKVAVVFKNTANLQHYGDSLLIASGIVINSIIPSRDAQYVAGIIGRFLDFMAKNNFQLNPPVLPKEEEKKKK